MFSLFFAPFSLLFSASRAATPSCPRFWMNWVSIYRTNSQVRSSCCRFCPLPSLPFLTSPPVGSRSSEHRRKLVGSGGEESRAPGRRGRRGRRPGGATEQPPERLSSGGRRSRRYKHTRISAIGFLFLASLAQHYLSEQCSEAVWLPVCCIFHLLSLLCLISRFQPTGIINLPPVGVDVFYLTEDFAQLSESDCQCKC